MIYLRHNGIKINIHINNYEALRNILSEYVPKESISEILHQLQFSSLEERMQIFEKYITDKTRCEQLKNVFRLEPEKMNYKSLAKKVRYFKHHQKGLKTMTDTLDDWAKEIADEARQKGLAEGRAEGRAEERKDARKNLKKTREQFAQKLIQAGVMTIEDIADAAGLTVKTVQKLAEKKAA